MKKLVLSPAVEMSLQSLPGEERQRVAAWFKYLERFEEDEVVQKNSLPLEDLPGVYMLVTTSDVRIFFKVEGDTLTVLDVAKAGDHRVGNLERFGKFQGGFPLRHAGQMMASVLEPIAFDPETFQKELKAFEDLLSSNPDLGEREDIQPFFKANKHLSAYIGTLYLNIAVATEICFEFDIAGDFQADILLGSKKDGQFCIVEFEDGKEGTLFKKKQNRKNPEWSSRFEHGFSQIVDWFYNLEDQKNSAGFQNTFGAGEVTFSALLVMGRDAKLDDPKRRRLVWRTKKVLIDSNKVTCITFDELYRSLQEKFEFYSAAAKAVATTTLPGVPPPP